MSSDASSLFLQGHETLQAPAPPPLRTSSHPHDLPKASSPNTVTLGSRASTYELGGGTGDTNIKSIIELEPMIRIKRLPFKTNLYNSGTPEFAD